MASRTAPPCQFPYHRQSNRTDTLPFIAAYWEWSDALTCSHARVVEAMLNGGALYLGDPSPHFPLPVLIAAIYAYAALIAKE